MNINLYNPLIKRLRNRYKTKFTSIDIVGSGRVYRIRIDGHNITIPPGNPHFKAIRELLEQMNDDYKKLNVTKFVYTPLEEYLDSL